MKKFLLVVAFALLIVFLAASSYAATICVGPSATGSGSGADWNNQIAWSSVTFARGNTYLIKGGSTYSGRTLDTADSGSTYITILGATIATGSGIAGWSNSYSVDKTEGGSQATFTTSTAVIYIDTDYWIFDGVAGPKFSKDPTAYGFNMGTSTPKGFVLGRYNNVNYVTLAHFSATAPSGDLEKEFIDASPCDTVNGTNYCGGGQVNYLTLQNFYVSGYQGFVWTPYGAHTDTCTGWLIQYGMLLNSWSSGAHHGEWINANGRSITNDVIRWNHFEGTDPSSSICFTGAIVANAAPHNNCQVYGNVFYGMNVCDNLVGDTSVAPMNNCQIYNNTFVANTLALGNVIGGMYGTSSGNTVYNNLIYNESGQYVPNGGPIVNWTRDYNAYFASGSGNGETHIQVGSGNPFVSDYITADSFQLSSDTIAGLNTHSTLPGNDVDANGVARGANGIWDIGAYQKPASGSGNTVQPMAPTLSLIN